MKDFPAALPHGPLTRIADGVHTVRGGFRFGPGMVISRTMTVIEGPDGLIVTNPVRQTEEGEAELSKLGTVKHLIKISDSHDLDEPYYVSRYSPRFWTLPGAKIGALVSEATLGPDSPVPGAIVVRYGRTEGWLEVGYFVPYGGGTLVTCDAIQNHVDTEGVSLAARAMTSLMGFKGGLIVPRMWRKYQRVPGPRVREVFAPLDTLAYENLVPGHGPAVVGGAAGKVREAIAVASM